MKEQPKKEKSENQLVQDFVNDYNELCKKHNLQIVTAPAWRARDDGTFSLVLQSSVGKLPKKE
jgi:hypothetical protein